MWLSAGEVKKEYGITYQTLYNWRNKNQIVFKKLQSGKYVYNITGIVEEKRKNVAYARVSTTKQKEDLSRQIQVISSYMVSNGIIVDKIYSDIASGMNENRKSFSELIKDVSSNKIDTVYVSFKDRLTRFGFGYIENFFKEHNTKIVVLNSSKEEDFQSELTEDLISIIHHFSMKMYSSRKKLLKNFSESLNKVEEENL